MITGPAIIWTDTSLGTDLTGGNFNRYGGDAKTTTTTVNKILVYKDNVLKLMTNNPLIMYGSTLKDIKEIWVGNTKVFGSTTSSKISGGIPVYYKYYYNGSWKSAQNLDTVSAVKSYALYSGNMQYGVYIGGEKSVDFSDINLYFNGTKITNKRDISGWSSGYQWTCKDYVVAIYNSSKSAYVSTISGSGGNMPNKNVNIPPQTIVFFNIDYCRNAFASGNGSGSGSGSSSGSDFLTNCYLSFKIKSISSDDTKVTLDFTGVNNYQAT